MERPKSSILKNRSFAAESDAAAAFYRKFFRPSPILPCRTSKSRNLVKMGHERDTLTDDVSTPREG